MPLSSLNTTDTRLFAGSKGTLPEPATKKAKVGVASFAMVVVTVGPTALMQAPVVGLVSHVCTLTPAAPVALTVMVPVTPAFKVATANTPVPVGPGISAMPGVMVAASAMMSGTGALPEASSNVFSPLVTGAGGLLAQSNEMTTSVGLNAVTGSKKNAKV